MKGGRRKGAGQKCIHAPHRCVYLTDRQALLLRKWGRGGLTAGLRWLIGCAERLVVSTGLVAAATTTAAVRRPAGRLRMHCVYLNDAQVELLRRWGGGQISPGLRWLIDAAEGLVVRKGAPTTSVKL